MKKIKPVRAWAAGKRGRIVKFFVYGDYCVTDSPRTCRIRAGPGYSAIEIEIRPVAKKRKVKK